MPRKHPLPESELAIARRLVELRGMAGLSRAELVKLCHIAHDLITRVELGITPLRYGDAARWLPALVPGGRFALSVNPLWLTDGTWPIQLEWPFLLPKPKAIGLPPRIRFSTFVASHRKLLEGLAKEPPEADLPESWILPYAVQFLRLRSRLAHMGRSDAWLYRLWKCSAERFAGESPKVARIIRHVQERRKNIEKGWLTESALRGTVSDMVTLLKLRAELKALTVGYGKKTELAKLLRVPRTSVSQWIAGAKEPGGETTLKLFNWVEQQKAKEKNRGKAPTPPRHKALQTKVTYEKRKPRSSKS
jgi:transcriptional regulator with XRE-family HTH domain